MPAGAVEKYFLSRNYWTALLQRMKRIRGRKHGDISCSLRICPTPVIWISSNETFVFAAPHLFISLCLPWAPLLSQTKWLAGYFTFGSWTETRYAATKCLLYFSQNLTSETLLICFKHKMYIEMRYSYHCIDMGASNGDWDALATCVGFFYSSR